MTPNLGKYFNKLTKSPLLNSVLIAQVLCGNYCGISDSKPVCFLLRLYCFVLVLSLSFFYFYKDGPYWIAFHIVLEYVFNAIFSFVTGQKFIFGYYDAINTCDAIMGLKNVPLIRWKTVVGLLVMMCNSFLILCKGIGFSIAFLPAMILLLITDFYRYMGTLYYSSILIRVKLLRKSLENNFVPVNIVGKDEVDKTVRSIRKCLHYYNNLMDTMRYFDKEMQGLLLLTLIYNVPKWIATLYTSITIFMQEDNPGLTGLLHSLLAFFQTICSVCSSIMVAEVIKTEIDEIKSTLASQLARCSDVSIYSELETTLRYIHLRPFTLSVLNIIEIDVKLPFSIIGVTVTYVIVALQFTHFTQMPQ